MTLNPQQQEAVEHLEGPLLILAGAGTGKTRVLTHRIAHLIQHHGLSPSNILAVTFTNKAAGEMKKRIELSIGNRAREVLVGTFHSVCVRILRRHAMEAGIPPQFVIFDAADQVGVVKETLKILNLDPKKYAIGGFVHRISRFKDHLVTAGDWRKEAKNPFEKVLADVYETYEKILQKNHALDFGDLIARTVFLFESESRILKSYQKMWRHILIDEYQDTNHAQYRFASLLAGEHKNICAVGDPDQSIYRWRGADLNNILNFERDYPGGKIVRLEQNYRSVQNLLKAASAVIANNELRKEKVLWSQNGKGEKITSASLDSEKEEAHFIISQFREWHRLEKIPYSEMAVFYRTNAQSRALEEILRMAGIPYMIYGGIRFYERAEIKDALAYLRIFALPEDGIGFKRIINSPPRGIGKTTIEKVEEISLKEGLSFFEAAKRLSGHAKLQNFIQWFENLRKEMLDLTFVKLLQKILETSGTIRALSLKGSVEAEERLSNINELVASLHDFETNDAEASLTDYLNQIALLTDLDQKSEGGLLSLMTLHLAKGLEFKGVAVVGLEEGLLPHARSLDETEELEEERRLFYVGMTRAKEKLLLTHAWRRYLNGREQYSLPSRFLEEIPKELICAKGKTFVSEETPVSEISQEYGTEYDESEYGIGTKVRHPDFGIGTVSASEKTSLGEKITVKFLSGAVKKLIAEYASLKKL